MSDAKVIEGLSAPLTQTSHALESSRDSGFDLASSVGEIVDNSIEARATWVRIRTCEAEDGSAINQMAFADNGTGIPLEHLASVLSLGYSSRYNSREGMGRFGVGLKLASLGQSRSVEVYTRPEGSEQIYCTTLDLDAVRDGEQTDLSVREVSGFPEDFADLMTDPVSGDPFKTGTLVLWTDIDRLPDGGKSNRGKSARYLYADTLEVRRAKLEKFLARAYRRFLADGRSIDLDGSVIDLYDPTFQLPSPRLVRQFGADHTGTIIQETGADEVVIDGHQVRIRVTLAPLATRAEKGKGAREFEELYLADRKGLADDNQAISIMREDREIYFALVPKMYPTDTSGTADLDRFIGVEVSFPASLDEYFQVRNVKRGAEPVDELRTRIRDFIQNPIKDARKQIRADWENAEKSKFAGPTDKGHEPTLGAMDRAADSMPSAPAKEETTPEKEQEVLFEIAEDHGIDPRDEANAPIMDDMREKFQERAIMITDGGWPGKDMFSIDHLSGKFVLKINHRHPFIRDVYDVVKVEAAKDAAELTGDDVKRLLMKVDVAFDVLLTAYAKAENMHRDPDTAYGPLRSYWGVIAAALINEGIADL